MYERTFFVLLGMLVTIGVISYHARRALRVTKRMQGWKNAFRDSMILEEFRS